jgi:hypothetical protein
MTPYGAEDGWLKAWVSILLAVLALDELLDHAAVERAGANSASTARRHVKVFGRSCVTSLRMPPDSIWNTPTPLGDQPIGLLVVDGRVLRSIALLPAPDQRTTLCTSVSASGRGVELDQADAVDAGRRTGS